MTIEEGLRNMERELRRMKRRNSWLLGTILLLAGGLIVPGMFETTAVRARGGQAGNAKEIRASAFILEDENGKMRAWLSVSKDGPSLGLYDEKGIPRVGLRTGKDDSALMLYDEKGKAGAGVALAVGKEGSGLALYDGSAKTRAVLTTEIGGPSLSLYDEKGNIRFAAGRGELASPEGKTITCPESSLILFGPDGKVIWSAIK